MARDRSDALFKLVHSLSKNEKRYFKVFNSQGKEKKKTLILFDEILNQEEFDDTAIIKNNIEISKKQISNLKAELYDQILDTLRSYNNGRIVDIKIRQLIDYSQILVDRCLYKEAYIQLKRAKKYASKFTNLELMLEISKLEKSIISQIIDDKNQKRVNSIIAEVSHINGQINRINQLSNLEAKLNSIYKKVGFIRDQRDHNAAEKYLNKNLPEYVESELTNIEKIYLYNLFIGYYFFIQDFESGNKEAEKMVALFESNHGLIISKTDFYISALNKLSISQSKLSKFNEFVYTVQKLQEIDKIPGLVINADIRARLYKYYYMHEFNKYLMLGDFAQGSKFLSNLENELEKFISKLDKHSKIILNYKIACMYFGNSEYSKSLFWLNKIINEQDIDIRRDIHCFARILNLVTHYEMGNVDVIDYYIRSTFRFLAKKYDLRLYQQYILTFLKNLGKNPNRNLKDEFKKLRDQLIPLSDRPYERRAFIYFDIISWLESKIEHKPVGEIIRQKALEKIK